MDILKNGLLILLFCTILFSGAKGQSPSGPASTADEYIKIENPLRSENRNLTIRFYLVALFAVGSFAGFMVVVSRYHKNLLETKRLSRDNKWISAELLSEKNREKLQVKMELEQKKDYLTGFALEISRKQELISDLYARLNKIKRLKEKDKKLEGVIRFLRGQIQVETS